MPSVLVEGSLAVCVADKPSVFVQAFFGNGGLFCRFGQRREG